MSLTGKMMHYIFSNNVISQLLVVFLVTSEYRTVVKSQLTEDEIQIFIDNGVSISNFDDNHWLFEHNGIPEHETGNFPNADNPNSISEQEHDYIIPKIPGYLDDPGCLEMGAIASAVNGIPFFNPYSAEGYNAVEGDYAEVFDECDGHPQQQGAYHYHAIPDCVYNGSVMQLLGVALDGYPIYGPLDADGVEVTSRDLDECHGRTYQDRYMYHATRDFPYILGCYRGTTHAEGERRKRQLGPPPRGGGGERSSSWSTCIASCENPVLGCDSVSNDDTDDATDGAGGDDSGETNGDNGNTPSGRDNGCDRSALSVFTLFCLICVQIVID